MNTKRKPSPESIVREIKRRTRRKYSAEDKIRIVLEGLRGEQSITDLCRREGIHPGIYYKWSKAFLEAGKQRLTGDTVREAGSEEVAEIRTENDALKQLVAAGANEFQLQAVSNHASPDSLKKYVKKEACREGARELIEKVDKVWGNNGVKT